ncbi:hypothetical protein ACFQE1_03330 [Halobium palmae]|uniref:Uncharacterized protein n=1 Tax=Halobium palmae TaxID=1776492 RepID=A0ABD5RWQ3_9EURY
MQLGVPPSLTLFGFAVQSLTLPLTLVAILSGALFVSVTPAHTTSLDWLLTLIRFRTSDRRLEHDEAKTHTHVERVHLDRNAIERPDGAVVGMLQIEPPSLALATDSEWAETSDAFRDLLDTTVEFPIQIHSATRPFPVETYLDRYERRRHDPDVEANPRLAALIDGYLDWYRESLAERQMTIREHYVVVPVTPAEVQFDREGVLVALADVPLVGLIVRAWFAPEHRMQQAALFDALDERLRRLEAALRGIDGCSAWRLDGSEATRVVTTFWNGTDPEYGDLTAALRTRPLGVPRR